MSTKKLRREQAGRALRDFLERWQAVGEHVTDKESREWWLPVYRATLEANVLLNAGLKLDAYPAHNIKATKEDTEV